MTHADKSPVTRETSARSGRRPLIVTTTAHLLVIREKGRRDRVEVPIDAIYHLGLKLRARVLRAEKLAKRGKR